MKHKNRFSRVLLINLPGTEQTGYRPSPLGILYLAAYLRENSPQVSVDIIDGAMVGEQEVFKKVSQFKPDLVGLSVMTPSRIIAAQLSAKIKNINPNIKILLGGIHPTLMWQQMMEHYSLIDFIIKGEGEATLADLVSNKNYSSILGLVWRKNKQIVNNYDRPLIKDLDNIPLPAWNLIDPLNYPARGQGIVNGIDLSKETRVPIIFSRGCMGSCTFCSTWKIWKGYRHRSGKNVANEIELLYRKYHAKHFVFQDDTLTGNRQEIINLCQEIINRKIKIAIIGCTRVDHVDLDLLKIMKEAGFYEISYGIESGSPTILKSINKKTDLEEIFTAAKITKKAGIKFTALMMTSLPNETDEDKLLSTKLIEKLKPDDWSSLGVVWIFPGTALYQQAKLAHLIDDDFWLSPRPYYIYRGGIGNDPIQWDLLIQDWFQDCSPHLSSQTSSSSPNSGFLSRLINFSKRFL